MSAQRIGGRGKRSSGALLILALGAAAVGAALAGTAREAEAVFPGGGGKFVFSSDRTTGTSVYNPTGDFEVFTMNRDGTGLTQLTFNTADDYSPGFSADDRHPAFSPDVKGTAFTGSHTRTTSPTTAAARELSADEAPGSPRKERR